MKGIKQLLPQGLDIWKFMKDSSLYKNAKRDSQREKVIQRAAYLIGQIYYLAHSRDESATAPIRLSSEILKAVVYDYQKYLSYFIEKGFIKLNSQYSNSKENPKCKGYRLNPKWANYKGSIEYTLDEPRILARISKQREAENKEAKEKYPLLFECFKELTCSIDSVPKELFFSENYNENNQRVLIDKLNGSPEFWTFKLGDNGRLYNPICNLKEGVRHHLRVNGMSLWEIDLKNSIPNFALLLFDGEVLLNIPRLRQLLASSNIKRYSRGSIRDVLLQKDHWSDDVYTFCQKVKNGKIYEHFAAMLNREAGKELYDREKGKKRLLAICNSPKWLYRKERKILRKEFPTPLRVVEDVNQGYNYTKKGSGNDKWRPGDLKCPFAYFTQGAEAWFVLDIICREVLEENPDCRLFTLHDAIYTTVEYVELVKEKIKHRSIELLGFEIKATSEFLGLSQAA